MAATNVAFRRLAIKFACRKKCQSPLYLSGYLLKKNTIVCSICGLTVHPAQPLHPFDLILFPSPPKAREHKQTAT